MNFCPACHTGRLQKHSMVYLEWYGQKWLIVNKMPAIVCDVCGERAYDRDAMEYLQQLLSDPPADPSRSTSTRSSPDVKHKGM